MSLNPRVRKLGRTLVDLKIIDEMQLASAMASAEQWGHRLTQALLHLRLAKESTLVDAIATATRTEKVDLSAVEPAPAALRLLQADFCQDQGIFPFALSEGGKLLHLAMADPTDLVLIDRVSATTRTRIKAFIAGDAVIQKAVQRYYFKLEVSFEPAAIEKPIAEMEELKLVNASGQTMALTGAVVSLKDALKQHSSAPGSAGKVPARSTSAAAIPISFDKSRASVAPTAAPSPPAATPIDEVKKQLAQIRKSQEAAQLISRALIELMIEKGLLTAEELRTRIRKDGKGKG